MDCLLRQGKSSEEIAATRRIDWVDHLLLVLAEFLGTIVVVFITCSGCTLGLNGTISHVHSNLLAGLSVMTAIQIFGHISGAYVNPAATVSALFMRQISIIQAGVYLLSQVTGGSVGYALVMYITPKKHLEGPDGHGHCVVFPSGDLHPIQVLVVEIIITSILCFSVCSTLDKRNANKQDSVPVRIGLVTFILSLAAGPYSGAGMNPARCFAPALWNLDFNLHWIYWLGPCTGGAIAGLFYKNVFLRNKD